VALPQARRGDLGATCARQSSPQVRRALPQEPDGSTCRGLRPSAPRRGALVRGHTGRTQWHPPCGALAHDHLFATRSSGQPVEPPAQHLDLLRHTVPYLCLWARRLGFPDTVGVVYASTEMAEPKAVDGSDYGSAASLRQFVGSKPRSRRRPRSPSSVPGLRRSAAWWPRGALPQRVVHDGYTVARPRGFPFRTG
jgi:hypothetical protein